MSFLSKLRGGSGTRGGFPFGGGLSGNSMGGISGPADVATWLGYWSAGGIPASGEIADDNFWVNDDTVVSGGPDMGGPTASASSRIMDIESATAGSPSASVYGDTDGNDGAVNVLTSGDLTNLKAVKTGSLFCQFYLESLPAPGTTDCIIGAASTFTGNRFLQCGVDENGGIYVELNTPVGATNGQYETWTDTTAGRITAGAWHTIAVTQDGTNVTAYIDGVPYVLTYTDVDTGGAGAADDWISDIKNSVIGICIGAVVEADTHVILRGTIGHYLEAGYTANGSLITGMKAINLHNLVKMKNGV